MGRMRRKIFEIEELAGIIRTLKAEGKRVVHCHGCFDLMHPGHIKYFQASKEMGDVLVVTVSPDIYIDKGPDRPVFEQYLRAESIAALECVDYVAINKWPTAEETLRLLRPDIYVKGQEFENLEDKTGKIQKEYEIVKEIGAEMRFTHEIVFSSTELINRHLRKR
jgi:rfaE bifunctional protein nucleotidyltransferase chain/domain